MPTAELRELFQSRGARRDYYSALAELRRRREEIAFAIPHLARMMLSADLGDRRLGAAAMKKFFPAVLGGRPYRWLMPSDDVLKQLNALVS
jgi:hypothetical protein